jgi:hypothetical protein
MNPSSLVLKDIHLPANGVSMWPLAPVWWLLIILVLVGLGALAWYLWKRPAKPHYQKNDVALQALADLQAQYNQQPLELLREVSVLLRRIALTRFGRHRIAGLTGTAWLAFLDKTSGQAVFQQCYAAYVTASPYQASADLDDLQGFLQAVRQWIQAPQGFSHV